MSVEPHSSSIDSSPAKRWRLWVDGCGGYLLLVGETWEVGSRDPSRPEICARADWPRSAGHIVRKGQDYFWLSSADSSTQRLIIPGTRVPTGGSASMTLHCPSTLSSTAVLSLAAPHRFVDHVDGIILADQTVLIGSDSSMHIQATQIEEQLVMLYRDGVWHAKVSSDDQFQLFSDASGGRLTLGSLDMTLEAA